MTTRAQILSTALGQLGVKEYPSNSNETKYNDWYGLPRQPWCAMFASWVMHAAGASSFAITTPKGFSYCPAAEAWARAHGHWINPGGTPSPADLVLFDWYGTGVADHVGIVVSASATTLVTVEGNTGSVSQNNGGAVMKRTRWRNSTVRGFVSIAGFLGATPISPASWSSDDGAAGHPLLAYGATGQAVRHLQGLLLHKGVNIVVDGAFGPTTLANVKRFQYAHGLGVDGQVGAYTWSVLHR